MRENLKVKTVPISKIDWGTKRFREDYKDMAALKASILERGLLQTLLVFERADGRYTLAAGGRRLIVLKELLAEGKIKDEVNVTLCPKGMTALDLRIVELEENIQRVDLSPLEQAALTLEIHNLMVEKYGEKKSTRTDAEGWSMEDTARMLGQSKMSVSYDIRLAKAAEVVPELKEAKTKKEAWKILEHTAKTIETKEIVEEISKKEGKSSKDKLREALCKQFIIGDFFEKVKGVADGVADLIEVDPPFGINLQAVKWRPKVPQGKARLGSYSEVDKNDYPLFLRKLLKECYRIGKSDSWLLLWFAPEPWFEEVYKALTESGYSTSRMVCVWYKTVGQSLKPHERLGNAYEMFFYAAKGSPSLNRAGRVNVFDFPMVAEPYKYHPTQKPIRLMEEIYRTFVPPGSRVVIPFLGSGAGLLAACNLKLTAFGYELEKSYKEEFVRKVYSQEYGAFEDKNVERASDESNSAE